MTQLIIQGMNRQGVPDIAPEGRGSKSHLVGLRGWGWVYRSKLPENSDNGHLVFLGGVLIPHEDPLQDRRAAGGGS